MSIKYEGKEFDVIDPKTNAIEPAGSTNSLFNPFYVFKYGGGVSLINPTVYVSNNTQPRHGATPTAINNPTASAIINWAQSIPSNQTDVNFGIQNSPYTWSDFLFCKWYGIIPNNRLITLRKTPLATRDDLSTGRVSKAQNIPVAQAVTWFGGPSENSLNSIWQNTWSLSWTKKDVNAKEVQGNEITNFSQSLVQLLPEGTNPFVKQIISNLATITDLQNSSESAAVQVGRAEIEANQQTYLKGLFTDNGAFFNQIQGPVNVKNTFLIRDRGLSSTAPDAQWKLIFEYKTDSYFGLNQRRVALDIIANMLALTYSDGEWLGSLNIYFKKLGIALRGSEQLLIEGAMVNGVLNPTELAKAFAEIAKNRAIDIIANGLTLASGAAGLAIQSVSEIVGTGNLTKASVDALSATQKEKLQLSLEVEITKALASSFPQFLQQRAAVPAIPTGNWHLTIGNPMNPIMRLGDIVVRSCTLDFGEELGPDDFPIDMKFTVTLSPTKPRDAKDIRQTFNIGRSDYISTFDGHTFDEANTYGIQNKDFTVYANSEKPGVKPPTTATDLQVARAEAWINNRYGKSMANVDYLKAVYYYIPPTPDVTSGSGGNG